MPCYFYLAVDNKKKCSYKSYLIIIFVDNTYVTVLFRDELGSSRVLVNKYASETGLGGSVRQFIS